MLKWFWTVFLLGAPVLYQWPPIKVPKFSLSKTHNLMESLVDHQRRQNFFCPDGFIIFHSFYSLVNHMAWSLCSLFVLPLLTVYEEHSLTACIYTYQYLEFACNISSFLRTISRHISKLVCKVRRTENCSCILIFALILKLPAQIASNVFCKILLQWMFLARIISWSPTIKPWQIQLTHSPLSHP